MSTDAMLCSQIDPTIAIDPALVAGVVEELPEALGVWIYGSFADGARTVSDIDIAILPEASLGYDWDYFARLGDLASRLSRATDLVDLRRVPPLLRFEVFQAGLRIAARDPTASDFFETATVSAYQRPNVERRNLLQEIRQRGTVY